MIADKTRQRLRGPVLVHATILLSFLLYLFLVPDLSCEKRDIIPNAARQEQFSLCEETNDVHYEIGRLTIYRNSLEIEGWAHIDGQTAENTDIYVILKSLENEYVYDTSRVYRPDITRASFNEGPQLNLDWSGFAAVVSLEKLPKTTYVVGLFAKKGDLSALRYTDQRFDYSD